MGNQVLSIDQMQELIDLGVDTSKASCVWWNFADLGFASMFLNDGRESITIEKMKKNHGAENIVPAFTLQDILEMLPNYVIVYAREIYNEYEISVALGEPNKYHTERSLNSLLEAAFNMLKWVFG